MAQPKTVRFGKFRLLLGNSESPEVYSAPCGFTEITVTYEKQVSEVLLPDCIDPDAPIVVGRDVTSISSSISGNGVMALESVNEWLKFRQSVLSWNVRLETVGEAPFGTTTETCKYHLTNFTRSASTGGRVQVSVELVSDGDVTISPALS